MRSSLLIEILTGTHVGSRSYSSIGNSGIEIPEAWMPTIKIHNNRRTVLNSGPLREQLLAGTMEQ